MGIHRVFESISWKRFEELCLDYIKIKYKQSLEDSDQERITISDNIGLGSHGCDAVIYYSHPIYDQRIWIEFKRYSKNLGLEVLGKYGVLMVSRSVNKFILLSASDVTELARMEMSQFFHKMSIRANFITGSQLVSEFVAHLPKKDLSELGILHDSPDIQKPIVSIAFLDGNLTSTYSPNWIESSNIVQIKKSEVFYFMLSIYNRTPTSIFIHDDFAQRIEEQISEQVTYLKVKFLDIPDSSNHEIRAFQCFTARFACATVGHFTEILTPRINVRLVVNDEVHDNNVAFPRIRFIRPNRGELLGHYNIQYLTKTIELLKKLREKSPFISVIKGLSGTGKTRLLAETLNQAKLSGISIYEHDAEVDFSMSIIRSLLSDCLNLQYGRYNVQYTKQYLKEICHHQIMPVEHGNNVHEFLINQNESDEVLYSVSEMLGFAMLKTSREPKIIAIDNVQDVGDHFINLLLRLVDICCSHQTAVALIFIINIEKINDNRASLRTFLRILERHYSNAPDFCLLHDCEELQHSDALQFLKNKLKNYSEVFLSKIINRVGRRPLDLEICSQYIKDSSKHAKSYKASSFVFNSTISSSDIVGHLYKKRLDLLLKHKPHKRKSLKILSWILLIEGGLPLEFLSSSVLESGSVDLLIANQVIRIHPNNRLCFYHGNIRDFVSSYSPVLSVALRTSEELLSLLSTSNGLLSLVERSISKFNVAFYLNHTTSTLLTYAYEAIRALHDYNNQFRALDICNKCLRSTTPVNVSNAEYYLYVCIFKGFVLMEFFNLKAGLEELLKYRDLIKAWENQLSNELIRDYFVYLINAHLHTGLDQGALKAISDAQSACRDEDNELRFHIINRTCVAYMHLGKISPAIDAAYKALEIASGIDNPFYISKGHSDLGYAFLHSIGHVPNNKAKAIESFNEAITLHKYCKHTPPSRDIEIRNQTALVFLFEGKNELCIESSEEGLDLCYKRHYMYLYPRLCLLGGTAAMCSNKVNMAREFFNQAMLVSEQYEYPRLWKIKNNLAIIDAVGGRAQRAFEILNKLLTELSKYAGGVFLFHKEQVIVRNVIYLGIFLDIDVYDILESIGHSEQYIEYINSCKKSFDSNSSIKFKHPNSDNPIKEIGLECIFM